MDFEQMLLSLHRGSKQSRYAKTAKLSVFAALIFLLGCLLALAEKRWPTGLLFGSFAFGYASLAFAQFALSRKNNSK